MRFTLPASLVALGLCLPAIACAEPAGGSPATGGPGVAELDRAVRDAAPPVGSARPAPSPSAPPSAARASSEDDAALPSPSEHPVADPGPLASKGVAKKKDEAAPPPAGGSVGPDTKMSGAVSDYERFKEAVAAAKTDAEATAALFVQALTAYTRHYDTGLAMVSLLLRPTDLKPDDKAPGGVHPTTSIRDDLTQLDRKPDIVRGYCGGTPAAKYEDADLEGCPITFDKEYSTRTQGVGYPSEGRAKFFIKNGGAASPRPVELEFYENDRWLVRNFGGLLTGVARGPTE